MKNPALMRMLAILLAVLLCFCGLSDFLGYRKAEERYTDALHQAEKLTTRYKELCTAEQALETCGIDYDAVTERLDELEASHGTDASQHMTDLSMYTATRSGYQQGADALWQAKAEMENAWAQFYAGKAAFQEQYDAFYAGKAELEQYSFILENYDCIIGLLVAVQNAAGEATGNLATLDQLLSAEELENLAEQINENLGALKWAFRMLVDSVDQLPEEQQQQINDAVYNATGKTLPQLLEELDGLDAVDTDTLREIFAALRGMLEAAGYAAYNAAGDAISMLEQLKTGWDLIIKNEPALLEGKRALDEAEELLNTGENTIQYNLELIWYELGQLGIEQEELAAEKEVLLQEADELIELNAQKDEYETLTDTRDMAKRRVTSNAAVKEQVEQGSELQEAVELVSAGLSEDAEQAWRTEKRIFVLVLAGVFFGLLTILCCFEKIRPIVCFYMFTLLVCACMSTAFYLNEQLGNTKLYVPLITGIFAGLMLLVCRPKKTKKVSLEAETAL